MLDIVNLYDAKTHLSQLVERAAKGEEIVIAEAGKPKAKLVPYRDPVARREPANRLGITFIARDFDESLPPEIQSASEDPSRHPHFLWWNSDPRMISGALREAIAEPGNEISVSAASVWDIAIKRALGKLAFAPRHPGRQDQTKWRSDPRPRTRLNF